MDTNGLKTDSTADPLAYQSTPSNAVLVQARLTLAQSDTHPRLIEVPFQKYWAITLRGHSQNKLRFRKVIGAICR